MEDPWDPVVSCEDPVEDPWLVDDPWELVEDPVLVDVSGCVVDDPCELEDP